VFVRARRFDHLDEFDHLDGLDDLFCFAAFYSTLKLPLEVPSDEALIDEQLPPEPTDPMVSLPPLSVLLQLFFFFTAASWPSVTC
jgi:hypothetical protein